MGKLDMHRIMARHNTTAWNVCIIIQMHLSHIYQCTPMEQKCAHSFLFFNTLRPRQNGRHSPDDIFKWIFLNENVWISINISLKFVPRGPINNIPTLVQVMAWRRPGDKPLSEPMTVTLPTHICFTRPQWVKYSVPHMSCIITYPWGRWGIDNGGWPLPDDPTCPWLWHWALIYKEFEKK